MKFIFGDEFIFYTSSLYEICLYCHWLRFSSFILNVGHCDVFNFECVTLESDLKSALNFNAHTFSHLFNCCVCLAKEDVSFALRKFMSLPGLCALCVEIVFTRTNKVKLHKSGLRLLLSSFLSFFYATSIFLLLFPFSPGIFISPSI